jgi:hypothetical protein
MGSPSRNELRDQIALWQSNVLDASIVVDDKRAAVERAPGELLVAERDLAAAVTHLEHLVEMFQQLPPDDAD